MLAADPGEVQADVRLPEAGCAQPRPSRLSQFEFRSVGDLVAAVWQAPDESHVAQDVTAYTSASVALRKDKVADTQVLNLVGQKGGSSSP